jgi:hypothetical protein
MVGSGGVRHGSQDRLWPTSAGPPFMLPHLVLFRTNVTLDPWDGPSPLSRPLIGSTVFVLLCHSSCYASSLADFLLFAPAMASWFSTESDPLIPVATDRPVDVQDVYIIAARLLGLYSLLSGGPQAGTIDPRLQVPLGTGGARRGIDLPGRRGLVHLLCRRNRRCLFEGSWHARAADGRVS